MASNSKYSDSMEPNQSSRKLEKKVGGGGSIMYMEPRTLQCHWI